MRVYFCTARLYSLARTRGCNENNQLKLQMTCIDILDRTCHLFPCSACVYCAVAVWWGAAEGGEHLHGRAEPVWGTVEVHSEPWEGDQELIEAHHVSSRQHWWWLQWGGLKKSKISRVAVRDFRAVFAPSCLSHMIITKRYFTPVMELNELTLLFLLTPSICILHVTKHHLTLSLTPHCPSNTLITSLHRHCWWWYLKLTFLTLLMIQKHSWCYQTWVPLLNPELYIVGILLN